MSSIEKYISPFIAQQFPAFYKDQGPNFIAFVKAYYEWLEQSNNTIYHSRSLLDYSDIDTTADQFIKYFKNQYVLSMPDTAVVNKRLLQKHILDLYRAKGSPRAVELLFRMVFGENIEIYVPGEFIFKPSDNTWKIPKYLEVSSVPNLTQLIGKTVETVNKSATAIVENYSKRIINGRTVNTLEVSAVTGAFKNGDKIFPVGSTLYTESNAPVVLGSLIAIAVNNGGQNFSVGDILDVSGSGISAKARVAAVTTDFSGAVDFILDNGGSGYTLDSVVSVKTTLNLRISNASASFTVGESVVSSNNSANGTVSFANTSTVQLVDFGTLPFSEGDTITGSVSSANASVIRVLGGTGTGASFKVGSLVNKEIISYSLEIISSYLSTELESTGANSFSLQVSSVSGTFNSNDTVQSTANSILLEGSLITGVSVQKDEELSNTTLGISGLYAYRPDGNLIWCTGTDTNLLNANIAPGAILVGNTSNAQVQLTTVFAKETITGNGLVNSSNATHINLSSVNGYFVTTASLVDSNTAATATIDGVTRLTDWGFSNSVSVLDNLDTTISSALPEVFIETGTIGSLSFTNPGSGYLTKPFITVQEPIITPLNLYDINGTLKGNNAIIDSLITAAEGSVSALEVIDSGFGYLDNESLVLSSSNNTSIVDGTSIVYGLGKGSGKWLNRKSFTSDITKIQDSLFYQNYSYEIIAKQMLGSYETLVRNLVHPAGVALFGRYRSSSYVTDDQDQMVQSTITQQ
jgi:hypothetical protein